MRQKNIIILVVLVAEMIAYNAISQENMTYSVLAIEYIGDTDKPIAPIVISDSRADAEWFRTTVLKRSDLEITSINVVSSSQMKSLILDTERRHGIFQQEQEKAQKSLETISVTIVEPQKRDRFLLSTSAAVSMLDNFKTLCKDDEPLQSNFSHFQKRILF